MNLKQGYRAIESVQVEHEGNSRGVIRRISVWLALENGHAGKSFMVFYCFPFSFGGVR